MKTFTLSKLISAGAVAVSLTTFPISSAVFAQQNQTPTNGINPVPEDLKNPQQNLQRRNLPDANQNLNDAQENLQQTGQDAQSEIEAAGQAAQQRVQSAQQQTEQRIEDAQQEIQNYVQTAKEQIDASVVQAQQQLDRRIQEVEGRSNWGWLGLIGLLGLFGLIPRRTKPTDYTTTRPGTPLDNNPPVNYPSETTDPYHPTYRE